MGVGGSGLEAHLASPAHTPSRWTLRQAAAHSDTHANHDKPAPVSWLAGWIIADPFSFPQQGEGGLRSFDGCYLLIHL